MKIGLNGKVVEAHEAVISVYDHGFLYGLGLFETFRTYQGRPYLLERHMARLKAGCAELGIPFGMSIGELESWISMLLRENGLKDGYVRLTVSAGEGVLGLPTGDYEQPNIVLLVKELPLVNGEAMRLGKELRLLRTVRNTPEGTVRFKSLHYMNNIMAKRELLGLAGEGSAHLMPAHPGAEGLMLTREGWLSEGIVSNLFFLRGRIVRTPAIDTGILPGITRQRVLELAADAGYEVEEGRYRWEELVEADEIWMTNSIQELIPITQLTRYDSDERIEMSGSSAGPMTMELQALYQADTGK
ncbi:4-amino-4-deoxychorismate lyase [Paenibacillus sp. 1011MAR3C5]|uniref:aminotransferase class IV n=1 Tax=Paenibacillus sp. 1011MAR3C5 TaxID=1675787 RepID=UPI000E6D3848|nr:aminotransferase class IV [Paenibacillus sp. 1011MAR3C5]RJE83603.1 4-amino-4-deoxychorismate lyase [Paenibacillus sp. 1011MAR3C5]